MGSSDHIINTTIKQQTGRRKMKTITINHYTIGEYSDNDTHDRAVVLLSSLGLGWFDMLQYLLQFKPRE